MALINITEVTGGATVRDGVVSWVPAYSRTSFGSINAQAAQNFDITSWTYIREVSGRAGKACTGVGAGAVRRLWRGGRRVPARLLNLPALHSTTAASSTLRWLLMAVIFPNCPNLQELIPTMIPGIVFGGLAFIAAVLCLLCLCVSCCCRCCRGCAGARGQRRKQQLQAREQHSPQFNTSAPAGPEVSSLHLGDGGIEAAGQVRLVHTSYAPHNFCTDACAVISR